MKCKLSSFYCILKFCLPIYHLILAVGASHATTHTDDVAKANASYSLLLPGRTLYLNALLEQRKFRDRGNKDGAVKGFKLLEEAGLGKVIDVKPHRGTNLVII